MKEISIRQSARSRVPEAAVILTDEEVLEIQKKNIKEWIPQNETLFLRKAPMIVAGAAAMSSVFIMHHYRQALKLRRYGEYMSYLPGFFLPAALANIVHKRAIRDDIIVMKTRCSVCLDLRALALQSVVGTLHPIIIATIASFSFSQIYFTYRLPSLTYSAGRLQLLKVWYTLTKPFFPTLSLIAGAHVILAVFITKMQIYEYQSMLLKQNLE